MEISPNLSEKAKHDLVLVEQAIAGNQKSYAELLDRYKDAIYFMLLKMVNNKSDAEDLTIEAFGKALKSAFEGVATIITAAANGIATIFGSLQNVDVTKLLAIGPALIGIGVGLASLGAGGVIAAIGSFLGGDPIKKIEALAASGDGLQKASIGLQGVASGLTQVAAALAAIDTSKLEALNDFSSQMSVGSAVKGITDFITSPIKAIGGEEGAKAAGGIDLTPMVSAINEVRDAVNKLYSKNTTINMDGTKVGTTLTQGSYKVA
jgi:hypothetical protein